MNQQELRQLENRCIQEHAPTCTATCPIHVDVRGMVTAIQQGDFAGGLKILRKASPFPGIISHICDQPCQAVCRRGEAGAPIAIAALEKACVNWAGTIDPVTALPPKAKRVAVVGGGLSGMTVAYDLKRKGYGVAIYEAQSHLGGRLWEIPQERLPWSVISQDVSVLERLGVEIFLDTSVNKVGSNGRRPPLALLCEQYEAVYLGTGVDADDIYDLTLDAQGRIQIDPVT
jgi:NADPH-dependent glutamate synthase beta subunit-like oxidoreductase